MSAPAARQMGARRMQSSRFGAILRGEMPLDFKLRDEFRKSARTGRPQPGCADCP